MTTLTPQKLGPGHLKFGETGSEQEFGSLTTATTIEPSIKESDPVPMLDGSNYVEQGEILGTLKGTFYQEYSMKGLTAWTWTNGGKELPFEFRPRNDSEMLITGKCMIKPVKIGGDPNKANTADFEFTLTTAPKMTAAKNPTSRG
ncbi:hypothetical protein HHJ78_04395 [Mobiluncus mulieris]|uniref:Phage tail protein n=1 Tax=Mobiluncus mulieris TaxID=2052 RepID=A0A7Y0Y3U7_9ACTO|nr:hypothetical protein [Mobiluncus mulieris]NMW64786.1 hypothetical protein [Mobiluncus mulieris]